MSTMRLVKGKVVGNSVVLKETLPPNAAVDVLVHEPDSEKWTLTDKGWAKLREAIDRGEFVTDEHLHADLDAIDAE